MKKTKKAKRKYLIQGRDWNGWACKMPVNQGDPESEWILCHWAESAMPMKAINCGKWVRVKFVEVERAKP